MRSSTFEPGPESFLCIYFILFFLFTYRENELLPNVDDEIQNPRAFETAIMVADFLFNTHRYIHAIDLYEEVISLLSLFAFKTELPVGHSRKKFDAYVSDLSNKLKATKEILQSEHDQEKGAFNEVQSKTFSSNFLDDGSGINDEEERKIAFYETLGSTFYSVSRYHASIWYFKQAAEMIKATGNKLEEQRIYTNLAIVYNAACQFDKAFSFQEKALKLSQENGDIEGQLECYCSLGSLCNDRGQFDRAISYYSKCLGRNNKRKEAMALNSIGNAYLANGQYAASISRYEESLEMRQEVNDTTGTSITYNNLSCAYYCMGRYEIAIQYQEQACQRMQSTEARKLLSVSYSNLGGLYQALGKYDLSLENYNKGLNIRKELGDIAGECRAYREISSVYNALGQLRESQLYYEKANKLERVFSNKPKQAAQSGQWIAHREKGLEVIEDIGVKKSERLILFKINLSHMSRVKFYSASDQLVGEIERHEISREPLTEELKLQLDEQSLLLYKTLALRQIGCEDFADALLTLENSRARILVELLNLKKDKNPGVSSTTLHSLNATFSFIAKRGENLLFIATLQDSICLWFINRLGNLTFKSYVVPEDLKLNFSLINFLRTGSVHCEDRALASDDSADRQTTPQTSSKMPVEEGPSVAMVSKLLACPREDDELSFLHQVIFGVVKELPDDEEIIFVPEGAIFRCPFALLRNTNDDYLADKVRMRVIPSITTLKILQDLPTEYHSNVGALLVGDPFVPRIKFKERVYMLEPLPHALKEVEVIGNLLGEQESCLTGKKATKREVLRRIPEVCLLHFAAHGSHEEGAIALAAEDQDICTEESCILSVNDIAKVTVRAKLVVLSICHGARGRIWNAEGVVGMVRAFLVSGARSVLAPLWAIEDEATLAFMESFYKHLIDHNMSASRALHQTMKDMRNSDKFSEETQWAPFILYGDDVTLDWNKTTDNYSATGKTVNT